jgi:predicted GH43/DUF377 family glycosyl hydrolase
MHFSDDFSGRPCAKDPTVIWFGGRYLLYYSLPPGPADERWTIAVAESNNLLDWRRLRRILFSGGAESAGYCAPGAIVIGGEVHLFYQSYGMGPADAICHAVSSDGLNFARSPNPIFRPTGDWTIGRAIDAEVCEFGGRLLLYFATREPSFRTQMLGVAEADLGSGFGSGAWRQLHPAGPILAPQVPTRADDPGVNIAWEQSCIEAPAMAVRGGKLFLFYAGAYNNQPQQIGVAVSSDGVHFRRLLGGRPLVPVGATGTWNDRESGHPAYLADGPNGGWLFFQGNNRSESQACGKDTWYLSALRVRWVVSRDDEEVPEVSEP